MVAVKIRYIGRLLVIGLVFIVCGACQSSHIPRTLTDTDYQVYSAFLDAFEFYRNVPSKEVIIILNSTAMNSHDINRSTPWGWVFTNLGDRCRYDNDEIRCRKAQDPAWSPLFEVLKQPTTQQARLLRTKFNTLRPIKVLSRSQLRALNHDDDQLPVHYVFSLSNIVYSPDQMKALFFSGFRCGGTCGRGQLVMLEKVNQTWTLVDTFQFWIA